MVQPESVVSDRQLCILVHTICTAMGTWSTAIEGNDIYHDICNHFFDLYDHNHSMDIAAISSEIQELYKESFEDKGDEDHHNSWFALAAALWKCGAYNDSVFQKVKTIIESGKDIQLWKELDASAADLTARQKELTRFLQKLQTPFSKPRKRRVLKQARVFAPFEKGDCVAFRQENSPYTAYLCLDTKLSTRNEFHALFIAIRFYENRLPEVEDFLNGRVLILQYGNWKNEAEIFWLFELSKRNFNKLTKELSLQVIGKIPVPGSSTFHSDRYGGFSTVFMEKQLEYERMEPTKMKEVTLNEYFERPGSFSK